MSAGASAGTNQQHLKSGSGLGEGGCRGYSPRICLGREDKRSQRRTKTEGSRVSDGLNLVVTGYLLKQMKTCSTGLENTNAHEVMYCPLSLRHTGSSLQSETALSQAA